MKLISANAATTAFSRLELFAIIVAFVLVLSLVLPRGGEKQKSPRAYCVSNLKQVALGFHMWANDHDPSFFPMQLPEAQGGSKETVMDGQIVPTFMLFSNFFPSPQVFFCPEDKKRRPAKSFAALTEKSLSYTLGVDAEFKAADSLVSGDRNIAISDSTQSQGFIYISDPSRAYWTKSLHKGNGNLALADNSVHQLDTVRLQERLRATGLATNRLIVP